jgi:hypothetical protein
VFCVFGCCRNIRNFYSGLFQAQLVLRLKNLKYDFQHHNAISRTNTTVVDKVENSFVKWFGTEQDKELLKHSSVHPSQQSKIHTHTVRARHASSVQCFNRITSSKTLSHNIHCTSLHCFPDVTPISRHNASNRICLMGFVSKSASCFLPSTCSIPMSSLRYCSWLV